MKIIGQTAEGFLLSATEDEVAQLVGYWSHYNLRDATHRKLVPGDAINVSAMYHHLHELSRMPERLAAAQKTLQTAAEFLTLVTPVLPKVDVEPPKS